MRFLMFNVSCWLSSRNSAICYCRYGNFSQLIIKNENYNWDNDTIISIGLNVIKVKVANEQIKTLPIGQFQAEWDNLS